MRRGWFLGGVVMVTVAVAGCGDGGGGQLAGKVTYKGQPVRYATLVVTGEGGKASGGSTNEKGEYLIPDPPPGALTFQFITAAGAGVAKGAGPTRLPDRYAKANNGVAFSYPGGKATYDINLAP